MFGNLAKIWQAIKDYRQDMSFGTHVVFGHALNVS